MEDSMLGYFGEALMEGSGSCIHRHLSIRWAADALSNGVKGAKDQIKQHHGIDTRLQIVSTLYDMKHCCVGSLSEYCKMFGVSTFL